MRRAGIVLGLCVCAVAWANPHYYAKRGTWQETLRASREALARQEAEARKALEAEAKGFKAATTELKLGDKARRLRVEVAGLKQLVLRVEMAGEKRGGRASVCFGTPRLVAADGKATAVTRRLVPRTFGRRHFTDERHRTWQEAKLDVAYPETGAADEQDIDALLEDDPPKKTPQGRFATGLLLETDGEAVVRLDGKYTRFEAWVCLLPAASKPDQPVAVTLDRRALIEEKERAEAMRQGLWDLVRRDFADVATLHEQTSEERARIWAEEWTPGDMAALAERYARHCQGKVKRKAEELAKVAKTPADLAAVRELYYVRYAAERLAFARKTLEFVERTAPRPQFAAELDELEQAAKTAAENPDKLPEGLHRRVFTLRRRIILSHPALDFDRLLINLRASYIPGHMCDQYLGRHSHAGPGLAVLDSWKDKPKATLLTEGKLPPGMTYHPDLSFDGKRVLFAFCDHTPKNRNERGFWIYEIGVDPSTGLRAGGTGLRQLTGTASDRLEGWGGRATSLIEDWDPCYLPGGGFTFITTRSQSYGRCHGSRYVPTYMVYRANGDGTGIRQLSFGEANEWNPSVLHDGRIIYTRWDYINRHDTIFQSLWVMRPDGTATAHFYGNYSRSPCMIAEARAIPDSQKVVATATDHHGYTAGSIIVIDPRLGQDEGEPLTCITPELGWPESGIARGTTMAEQPRHVRGRKAATPWPLTEDLFLVAYQDTNRYAIYLIDSIGGRELIYRHEGTSCFSPIPLRPTPKPPVLRSLIDDKQDQATGVFYVQDVHKSLQTLAPGSIKRLRINEIHGQPTRSKPDLSRANNEIIKGILGTVPVAADGSAAFRAPAGVPLQLQALDGNGMAVMTMRSLVYLQHGEVATCVGCHESRMDAPPHDFIPPNVEVRDIEPPAGPHYAGGFSFTRTVQPVLDRYCISCHGLDKKDANLNLLGTRTRYNQAHDDLTARGGYVKIAYRNGETAFSKPGDYFALAGRLARYLLHDHTKHVKLDRESLQRVIDWLDLNAQFYGDYSHNRIESRRPHGAGEKELRARIAKLFGEKLAKQPFEALVNVAQPDESRILKAPLALEAGGWGQIAENGWASTRAPGYQEMAALVAASIQPLDRHDLAGTCGADDRGCRCGNCWVRKVRAQRYSAAHGKAAMATPR